MGRMRHTHQQERRARSTIKSLLMRASLQASQVKPCSLTHEILLCFTFQANTLEDILWWCFPSEHRISSSYFPIFPLIFPFISPFFGHTSLCCPHFLLNPPLSSYSPTFSAHFLPFSPLFSPFPIYFPSSPPFSQFSFHFPLRFPPFYLTFLHFSHSFPHSSLFFSSFPLPISSLFPIFLSFSFAFPLHCLHFSFTIPYSSSSGSRLGVRGQRSRCHCAASGLRSTSRPRLHDNRSFRCRRPIRCGRRHD